MMRTVIRGTAAVILLAATVLAAACGGGDDTPADVNGTWSGTLTLSYAGGGSNSGPFELQLDQDEDFVAGSAVWGPSGETVSVAGPIDGSSFSFRLAFTCPSENGTLVLRGEITDDLMEVTRATGFLCLGGGSDLTVAEGTGTLRRTRDNLPL